MFFKRTLYSKKSELNTIQEWIFKRALEGDIVVICKDKSFRILNCHEGDGFEDVKHSYSSPEDAYNGISPRFVIKNKDPHTYAADPTYSSSELVFEGLEYTVYEQGRNSRFVLHDKEKQFCVCAVRQVLTYVLDENKMNELVRSLMSSAPNNLHFRRAVTVILWCDGVVRGTGRSNTNQTCVTGIITATTNALRDITSKPIERKEIDSLRIEVCIERCDTLRVTYGAVAKNGASPYRSYMFEEKEGKRWYLLPAFANKYITHVHGSVLDSFLSHEKLEDSILSEYVDTCSVIDFIETSDKESLLNLYGPFVREVKTSSHEDMLQGAADYILRMQELDGNIIQRVDKNTEILAQIDFPRATLSALALTEAYLYTGKQEYYEGVRRYYSYLTKYLFNPKYNILGTALNVSYMLEMSLLLFEKTNTSTYLRDAESYVLYLVQSIQAFDMSLPRTDVALQHMMTGLSQFLCKGYVHPKIKTELILSCVMHMSEHVQNKLYTRKYTPKQNSVSLYAEYVRAYTNLYHYTGNKVFAEIILATADFFVEHQYSDGSFMPHAREADTYHVYGFVRATAKIAEVLPDAIKLAQEQDDIIRTKRFRSMLTHAIKWLNMLQYTRENTFFISEKNVMSSCGGFRCDVYNTERWTDANAHVVLALVRKGVLQ